MRRGQLSYSPEAFQRNRSPPHKKETAPTGEAAESILLMPPRHKEKAGRSPAKDETSRDQAGVIM